MNISQLGNNLRLARIRRGYSQEQAAEFCGISEKTLGEIERAQANMTVEVLMKIEDGLCLSLEELISGPAEADHLTGKVEYFAVLESCEALEPCEASEHPFTYGLMVCQDTPKGSYLLSIVHDVSTDPGLVMTMAKDFGSYELSPLHLMDAILDSIP